MPQRSHAERLGILETNVRLLEELPARVAALESQLLQLRTEMRAEFSAVRMEIRAGDEETRRYMRVLHEEMLARIAVIGEGRPGKNS